MSSQDRWTSLLWLLFAVCITIASFRLGIGTPQDPGMGFIAFGASVLLGVLSALLWLRATPKKPTARNGPALPRRQWARVVAVPVVLLLYARFMPSAGYLVGTFLLLVILLGIVSRERGWRILLFSSLTTVLTYVVFSKWLNCPFPPGLLDF